MPFIEWVGREVLSLSFHGWVLFYISFSFITFFFRLLSLCFCCCFSIFPIQLLQVLERQCIRASSDDTTNQFIVYSWSNSTHPIYKLSILCLSCETVNICLSVDRDRIIFYLVLQKLTMIRKGRNDNVAPALASLVEIGGNGLACHIKTKIDKTAPFFLCYCAGVG